MKRLAIAAALGMLLAAPASADVPTAEEALEEIGFSDADKAKVLGLTSFRLRSIHCSTSA